MQFFTPLVFGLAAFNGASASVIPKDTGAATPGWECGAILNKNGQPDIGLGLRVECTRVLRPVIAVRNERCGLCVFFDDDNCQGKITWSGGPGKIDNYIPPSYSYFCR